VTKDVGRASDIEVNVKYAVFPITFLLLFLYALQGGAPLTSPGTDFSGMSHLTASKETTDKS